MTSLSSQLFSWVFFGTKLVGGVLVALSFVLYINQDKLLYIPNPPGFPKTPKENPPGFISPGEWSVNGRMMARSGKDDKIPFEEHFVSTADGKKLHLWLMLQNNPQNVPTLLYFHGNAGNMGFRLKNAAEMFAKVKMNILMMDYRGFGSSEGSPNEQGLNADADAVLNFVIAHPKLTKSPIIAFGRSLGGAVSVSLAHRHPKLVSAIVLENTFMSVGAMVDVLMPFISPLKVFVLSIKWDSDVKISELTQPILFISGDADQLVPPFHMKKLFDLAVRSVGKVFFSVSGGTHNDTWEVAGEEYHRKLRAFIEDNALRSTTTCDSNLPPHDIIITAPDEDGAAPDSLSSSRSGVNSDEDNVEDPDYLMVSKTHIPTMGTNFQVKKTD